MKKSVVFFFFSALILPIFLSGCSSMGGGGSSNNAVNAQMGVLADEVTRLDQALQETRAQLQHEQARVAELENRLGGGASSSSSAAPAAYSSTPSEPYAGVYRTPAGFELPASSVQKALKNAGFYTGDMDGKVGPDTREAVRNFQRSNGLTPDGIIGKSTWNLLKKHVDEPAA